MKKTIKRCALAVCIFIFIFLTLPFITNSVTSGDSANSNKKEKGSPQIFTNNPLTDLVSRISNFFGGNKSKPQNLNQETGPSQLAISPEEYLAQAKAKYENPTEDDSSNLSNSTGFGLYTQNEEGDWVLLPQTTPEGVVVEGMHEGSIKANAYDKYLQQERTARLIPGVNNSLSEQENIPNSTMARIVNPIKNFFGFGNSATVKASDNPVPSQLVATAKNPQKTKNPKNARKAPGLNFSPKTPIKIDPSDEKSAEKALYALLDPQDRLDQLAEQLTEAKFPDQSTPESKEKAANFLQEKRATLREKMQQAIDQDIAKNITGDYSDTIENISKCTGTLVYHGERNDGTSCDQPPAPDENALEKRQQKFMSEVGLPLETLRHVSVVPVLSQAATEDYLKEMGEFTEERTVSPLQQKFIEKGCDKQTCFWVSTKTNKPIEEAISGAGLKVRYPENSSQTTTPSQDDKEFELYTVKELSVNKSDGQRPMIFYVDRAEVAQQIRQALPGAMVIFDRTEQHLSFSQNDLEGNPINTDTRSDAIVDSLIGLIKSRHESIHAIAEEGYRDVIQQAMSSLDTEAKQKLKDLEKAIHLK